MYDASLVEGNLGLVRSQAYEFASKTGLDYDDLYQEGVMGLMHASEKFDESMGNAFSTYAYWWIKQHMQRYIESSLNVSRKAKSCRGKIYELRNKYEWVGEEASPELIAKELGLSLNDVLGVLYPENISIYSSDNNDEHNGCLLDTLISDEDPIENTIEKTDIAEQVRKAIGTLKKNERSVIMCRFFGENGRIYTYEEIGEMLGISKQRVQQIERNAFSKLKHTKELVEYSRS